MRERYYCHHGLNYKCYGLKPCYVDNWTYELTTCSNLLQLAIVSHAEPDCFAVGSL